MRDQAEGLRVRLERLDSVASTKTIAVVSGKGGVGKSNFSLNFSISLSRKGNRVLLFDMDIGMGNIDILSGRSAEYSIVDYIENDVPLREIITKGPEDISYIAGGTGLTKLVQLDGDILSLFIEDLQTLLSEYDYLIFDMGAGVTNDSLQFLMSVHEVFVITTPEPTSLTDAYATMKHLHQLDEELPFYLICNRAQTEMEGKQTLNRLNSVLTKFLGKNPILLGVLPDDRTVSKAVSRQIPFVQFDPNAHISRAMTELVNNYEKGNTGNITFTKGNRFIDKLKYFLFER